MRYPASEKLEIIGMVEQSHFPAKRTLWNRIPDAIQERIIEMALEQSELSPRELSVRFTDETHYFVSEASLAA